MLDTVLIQTDITTVNFYPRDAMTVLVPAIGLSVLLSVYHNSGFYGNSWTKRAVFFASTESFVPPIQHCAKRKFEYLQK